MFKRAEMNTYEAEITCHSCGKKEKVKIKSLVDTALDPSAKTNLLRGKLFRHSAQNAIRNKICYIHACIMIVVRIYWLDIQIIKKIMKR